MELLLRETVNAVLALYGKEAPPGRTRVEVIARRLESLARDRRHLDRRRS